MTKYFLLCFIALRSLAAPGQDKHYSEWYLQREDADIFVKETGSGADTVIVVHGGFGANHDYMLDALEGLKDQFHFILYDQRGSLLSPAGDEHLTFPKNVDDLLALTDALQLQQAKIFCHSMGTLVGMEFARRHPHRVSHLVLAGAVLPVADSMQSVFSPQYEERVRYLATRQEVQQLTAPYKARGIDSLRSVQDIGPSGLSHRDLTAYWRIGFAAVNLYDVGRHHLLKGGRAYYKQGASVMAETVNWRYDYRPVLNTGMKTTIINGDHDFFDFQGAAFTALLQGYPGIALKIIPRAGHVAWIDAPAAFRRHLQEALTR